MYIKVLWTVYTVRVYCIDFVQRILNIYLPYYGHIVMKDNHFDFVWFIQKYNIFIKI